MNYKPGEPEFGSCGFITTRLKRTHFSFIGWSETVRCVWEEVSIKDGKVAALFLGWRTLSNGIADREEGYSADKYFRAALVCVDDKTNPFYVPVYQVRNFK